MAIYACPVSLAAALEVRPLVQLMKALGDETRLRIAALLAHGELCVCHVQEALELSQPHVSRHFGILRSAGVVEARRQGNWIYYRLAEQKDPDRRRLLESVVASFAKRDVLRRDVERLVKVRGPRACR
jgi:ArsR family transcriptional regulator, arsenate/arsenite/antimonite-responsive transcriptional repressor